MEREGNSRETIPMLIVDGEGLYSDATYPTTCNL